MMWKKVLAILSVSAGAGQEERNATYPLENGSAMKAYDSAGLEFRIKMILASPELLKHVCALMPGNLGNLRCKNCPSGSPGRNLTRRLRCSPL